jgi:hypothetical protein
LAAIAGAGGGATIGAAWRGWGTILRGAGREGSGTDVDPTPEGGAPATLGDDPFETGRGAGEPVAAGFDGAETGAAEVVAIEAETTGAAGRCTAGAGLAGAGLAATGVEGAFAVGAWAEGAGEAATTGAAATGGAACTGGAGRGGGAAASSLLCWMAFSTSPGLDTRDQSIFGLAAALSPRALLDPPDLPRWKWARTRSASSSSSELE